MQALARAALQRAAGSLPPHRAPAARAPLRHAMPARHACAAAGAPPGGVKELSVAALAQLLASGAPLQCIDVREPWEHETASLPGFKLLPLSRIQSWAGTVAEDFDPAAPTVVLCHHGVRSRSVSEFLSERCGFADVSNISGGIDAYSRRVDAAVPLY